MADKMALANVTMVPLITCDDIIIPTATDYFADLSTGWFVGIIICSVMTCIIVIIFLEARYHIVNEMGNWQHARKSLILLGIYPIVALNAMAGLCFPRAASLTDLTTYVYYSVCIYVFSQMLLDHYGGRDSMAHQLRGEQIKLQAPPLCCCCCCLPEVNVSRGNLHVIEVMVMQFVILRPVLMYCVLILTVDSGPNYLFGSEESASSTLSSISSLNTISTFTAVWGNVLLFRVSIKPLRHVQIVPRFYLVQLVVSLDDLLKLILNSLVSFNVIVCDPPLSTTATSMRIALVTKTSLVFICAIVARYYYRVDKLRDDLDENFPEFIHAHDSVASSKAGSGHGTGPRGTPRRSYGSLEDSTGVTNPSYQYPNLVQTQPIPSGADFITPEGAVVDEPHGFDHQASQEDDEKRRASAGSPLAQSGENIILVDRD